MNLLDLFSGIGGFSLGLERAGFRTVAFCELEPYCRRVLAHHWPGVPICHDVRDLDAAWLRAVGIDRIDAICGGFPCQDISLAGGGAGLLGERSGLWREFARLLGELRPRFAFVENVGALTGRGLAEVLADLAALGRNAEWHVVPAAAVGAPHLRDRCWIVSALDASDADSIGLRHQPGRQQRTRGATGEAQPLDDGATRPHPDADGWRCKQQRQPQHRDEQGTPWREPDGLGARGRGCGQALAHAPGAGLAQRGGLQRRLARALAAAATPWPWTAEPAFCGLDDGLPRGVARHRLKALGNSIVPAIPEILGRAVLDGRA